MKRIMGLVLALSLIFSAGVSFSYGEGSLEYQGYRQAYFDKLMEFRNEELLLDGEKPIGRDAALVSHFNGEIPALFTISYYRGSGGKGVNNYRYSLYLYKDGGLERVRLSQNMIDNDADYNFYGVNVGGSNPGMFKNDYYLARDKDSDLAYLLSHMDNQQDGSFEGDQTSDPWEMDGYRQEYYRLENFLRDIGEGEQGYYVDLDKRTNPRGSTRYFYQDTSLVDKPRLIGEDSYRSLVRDFQESHRMRLLGPRVLDEREIREILLEDRDINVVVDNKLINLHTAPLIKNDRTLVPARSIFEALDMEVDWDPKAQLVRGTKGAREIKIFIDKDLAYIDGRPVKLDTRAIIERDRTLVPVRFIAEAIGGQVTWLSKEKIVNIDLR